MKKDLTRFTQITHKYTHSLKNCNFQTTKPNFGYAFEESVISFHCKNKTIIYCKIFNLLKNHHPIYATYIYICKMCNICVCVFPIMT